MGSREVGKAKKRRPQQASKVPAERKPKPAPPAGVGNVDPGVPVERPTVRQEPVEQPTKKLGGPESAT